MLGATLPRNRLRFQRRVKSLSIKKAINAAFENVVLSMDKEFQEMIDRLNNMMEKEKIKYLGDSYFPFHVYKLFLQIIDLYEEEGEDDFSVSDENYISLGIKFWSQHIDCR